MSSIIAFAGKFLFYFVPLAINAATANPLLTVSIVAILAACVIIVYAIHKDCNVNCLCWGIT